MFPRGSRVHFLELLTVPRGRRKGKNKA
jgi:hypothetical protein